MKKFLRCAGVILTLVFFSQILYSQPRGDRINDRVVPLSERESVERWIEFLAYRPNEGYVFDFVLSHMPRRDDSVYYDGSIFGSAKGENSFIRIFIKKRGETEGKIFLLLTKHGKNFVYLFESGKLSNLEESEWTKPMMEGILFSPFDLMTPYKSWDSKYIGPGRIGKAVHFYKLKPDSEFLSKNKSFGTVEIALGREFNAPVQVELKKDNGDVVKTLTLGSVKKIKGTWIMKDIELRDELSRDKDKLSVIRADVNLNLDEKLFSEKDFQEIVDKPKLERL